MKVTINEVNNVLKTLPIGYYTGHRVDVVCEDGNSCFFNHRDNTIHIGFDIINMALSHISEDCNIENETAIRTVFFHEVSHTILTPCAELVKAVENDSKKFKVMNIFEDERIETLLRDYYIDTNFKSFIKLVNGGEGSPFYKIVRYREGPEHFVNEVSELISKFKNINCDTDCWTTKTYSYEVLDFYNRVVNELGGDMSEEDDNYVLGSGNGDKDDKKNGKHGKATESDNGDDQKDKCASANGDKEPKDNSKDSDDENNGYGRKHGDVVLSKREVKRLFDKKIDVYADPKMTQDFKQIFKNFKKRGNFGGHINGYSGVFNPRNVANNNYKYFTRTYVENNGGNGSMHLNLWIDVSGSYRENESDTNKIIKSLEAVEKENRNFTFDVITVSEGHQVLPKDNRYIRAGGCNYLYKEMLDDYKKMQKPGVRNYNIVLFDGECYGSFYDDAKYLRAFDHDNVFVITDTDNIKAFDTYCPKPHRLYHTKRNAQTYSEMLKSKINDILTIAFSA